jgi:2-methylcitrate dehydratase
VHEVKRYLLDSLGCAYGAVRSHECRMVEKVLREMGGREEASLIGSGAKLPVANAALYNSLLVRGLDYNDIYWDQDPSHPSDIIPAALAVGECEGRAARDVITAIALAYEFEIRMCEAADPGIRENGWHHATLTAFVSPIVAGSLMGLDGAGMANAIAVSGCHSATLGSVTAGTLTMMKNTVDPMAVQAGVFAALLAREGYVGPREVFEGKEGVSHTLPGEWNFGKLTDRLGEEWGILRCGMKAYPTEALTHSPISAVLQLRREQGFTAADVEEVHVKTVARAADILADPKKYEPTNKETADHSLPFVIAAAVVHGQVVPEHFHDEQLGNPEVRGLLRKVKVSAEPEFEKIFPAKKPTAVAVTLRDGSRHEARLDFPKGDYRNPMTDEEVVEKFRSLTSELLSKGRQDAMIEEVWKLDSRKDLQPLVGLYPADSK